MVKYKEAFIRIELFVAAFIILCMIPFFSYSEGADADSMLETGMIVNAKMKSLAAGTDQDFTANTNEIKAICMASVLPDGFIPTDANTVSTPDSRYPIYILY